MEAKRMNKLDKFNVEYTFEKPAAGLPEQLYTLTFTKTRQRVWWQPRTWAKGVEVFIFTRCTLHDTENLQAIFKAEASN